MPYVDGFVLPVPKKKLAAYKKMAKLGSKVWKEHGALEYMECVGDDLKTKMGMHFGKTVKAKPSETVVFAWVVYKSRAHRDQVMKKVMKDKRMNDPNAKDMPFDWKRMAYGGFKTIVEA